MNCNLFSLIFILQLSNLFFPSFNFEILNLLLVLNLRKNLVKNSQVLSLKIIQVFIVHTNLVLNLLMLNLVLICYFLFNFFDFWNF